MNSLFYERPGVRLLFELVLRKFSMAMLPEPQQEMKPLRPPKEFWNKKVLERATAHWHDVKGWVDHGTDVALRPSCGTTAR